ncbi:MAG: hypothetical protein ACRCVJ_02960 [Clostridium sp.]|uniref:hypothetical protein n=1 Tax=Clostridium sp. TaxID=1506 RepID=UPI003F3E1415
MIKKAIGVLIATTVLFSLAGCGNKKETKSEDKSNTKVELNIDNQEQFKDLKGDWIRDFTYDDFNKSANDLMVKVEDTTKGFGLDYQKDEKVEQIQGNTANVKSIYLDNKNPENNKLESLQFESQLIGNAQQYGRIQMKLSLKFDGAGAIKDNNFNLGDTSIAKYAEIMTNTKDRDYKDINNKIMDIIKSDKSEGVVKDSINGLEEEFAVSKDYIVYTLSTKIYEFTKAPSEGVK